MAVGHIIEREIPAVLVYVQVSEGIGLMKGVPNAGERTVQTGLAILLQHDIDDTIVSLGVIFCGGVGHDLDAFDLIGGDLVKGQGRCLPSSKIVGEPFRRLTLPAASTCSVGTWRRASWAVPPLLARLWSTLKTFLSISVLKTGLERTTVTASIWEAAVARRMARR